MAKITQFFSINSIQIRPWS